MITPIAKRLSRVEESATLKMAAATRDLMAQGHKIYNFTVGEPHFPIPKAAQEAAIEAVRAGKNKYSPVGGNLDLRQALVKKLKTENGLSYTPDQILVSIGAKHSIFNLLLATLDEGDEVLIPAPYWTSYPEMVKLCDGDPVILPTEEKDGFKLSAAALKKAIGPKTKMLILNSPSNPTGSVYTKEELQALAKVLEGTQVLVCSDEIYEKLMLNGQHYTSFGALSEDAFSRTVTINGFSKAYAMTGWRLGYAAGALPLIKAMHLIQGQCTSGANTLAQAAGVAALGLEPGFIEPILDELRECRKLMTSAFAKCPLVSFVNPDGAFYLFLNIGKVLGKSTPSGQKMADAETLALHLLKEAHVSTVPGAGFGAPNYLRMSFSSTAEDINEGCRRVIAELEKLR